MACRDAKPARWYGLFGRTAFAIVVIGTCVAIRCVEPTPSVSAQQSATRRPTPQPSKSRVRPAANHEQVTAQSQKLRDVAAAPNDVVAVVNGQRITRKYLARECIRRFGEDVLESLVNKQLILEACRENGIRISAQDVENEVDRMAAKFSVPTDQWLAMLEDESGLNPTAYRRDVVWPTLALKRLAAEALEVSKPELEQAYESEYGPMVQVRLITTSTKSKAEKLHAALSKQPDRFEQLAKEHSEDVNSAAARGLIPPIRRHVGEPELEKVAFALKPGEISSVIPVARQFAILKCDRHIPARELGEKQKQLVLAQLKDKVAEQKLRTEGKKVFGDLQQRAAVVNVYNDPVKRKQMPGVAATVNGNPITLEYLGEQCLLRHGKNVLDAEINRTLLQQALQRRSLQVQKADLNAEIRRAAESFGYFTSDGKPDMERWLKQVGEQTGKSVDLYVRDAAWPSAALKKLVSTDLTVTEEDLQKSFLANYGERVEVQAIVLSDQRTAHEVFDLARRNPTEKFFGELANQYSIEPVSKANYGQVPPIRMHGGQPALEKEAFGLQPNQISGIIVVGDAFIILRCLGRTQPIVDDSKVVENELKRDIVEKKMRIAMTAEFDRLKESAQIDNFLAKTVQPGSGQVQPASHQREENSARTPPATASRRQGRR